MGYYTQKKLGIEEKSRLLTGGGYWTSASLNGTDIPSVRFSDGPAGLRPQGDKGDNLGSNKSFPATCYPAHSALACSWNRRLCSEVGARIGSEAGYFGVDVVLAPDLNIKRNPLCGRNFEYFSEDPYLNGKLGAAFSNGLSSSGAGACIKHFAANNREFGRMVCDSVIDERTLREIYLTGFEIAVKEGKPAAVMTAYNRLNGVYCSENINLIEGILRGEWGFDGIVVSDWGGTNDRVEGVKAGADLEMPPCAFSAKQITDAVKSGKLAEECVDKCAERIIKLACRDKKVSECDFKANADFAAKCAEECAVLLKNDGILPLSQDGKIALIGDIAVNPVIQGGGSSKVNPNNTDSLYGCLKDKLCGFERGYAETKRKNKLKRRALKLCGAADTVIFCAGQYGCDIEGADRESINLPDNQTELLNAIYSLNKRVVVIVFGGSVIDTSWDGEASALLFAGLGGQAGARAVADILFGKVCPSGKLAETFPLSLESVPGGKFFNVSPYYSVYGEGMDVGYRCFGSHKVKYAFGFGLSYTCFSYGNLQTDEKGVSFDIINTGKVRGGETAQMYVKFPDAAHSPSLQLKGFEKVFLDAGETKRVRIDFDCYTFRSYDTANGRWAEVSGRYEIFVGCSSDNLLLTGYIDRLGDCKVVAPPSTDNLHPTEYKIQRDKRGRVIADIHTPLCELKNAKGLFGRLFAKIILRIVKNKKTVYGSMQYLPLRTMAQFGKMKYGTIDGLILMFNGSFFKGLLRIIKG